jgi:hypothetical protein
MISYQQQPTLVAVERRLPISSDDMLAQLPHAPPCPHQYPPLASALWDAVNAMAVAANVSLGAAGCLPANLMELCLREYPQPRVIGDESFSISSALHSFASLVCLRSLRVHADADCRAGYRMQ